MGESPWKFESSRPHHLQEIAQVAAHRVANEVVVLVFEPALQRWLGPLRGPHASLPRGDLRCAFFASRSADVEFGTHGQSADC